MVVVNPSWWCYYEASTEERRNRALRRRHFGTDQLLLEWLSRKIGIFTEWREEVTVSSSWWFWMGSWRRIRLIFVAFMGADPEHLDSLAWNFELLLPYKAVTPPAANGRATLTSSSGSHRVNTQVFSHPEVEQNHQISARVVLILALLWHERAQIITSDLYHKRWRWLLPILFFFLLWIRWDLKLCQWSHKFQQNLLDYTWLSYMSRLGWIPL